MTALMDKVQLAARLNVPVSWVRDAITARSIPISWIGRHARFSEADFVAISEANHETPAPRSRRRSERVVLEFQPRPSRRSA